MASAKRYRCSVVRDGSRSFLPFLAFLFGLFWIASLILAREQLNTLVRGEHQRGTSSKAIALMEFVREHGLSRWNDVRDEWRAFQQELRRDFRSVLDDSQQPRSRQQRDLRVLVVTSVGNDAESVTRFGETMAKLSVGQEEEEEGDHYRDVLDFAFFHYDGSNALWEHEAWYRESPRVVLKHVGKGCKVQFWQTLLDFRYLNVPSAYDYVWFIDEDLDFTFFDWEIFRTLLVAANPVAMQPAILPVAAGERAADYSDLKLQFDEVGGEVALAHAAPVVEVMAMILSTKVWPALNNRMASHNGSSAWGMDGWWSKLGRLAKKNCPNAKVGNLVVDASPLVHVNTHKIDRMNDHWSMIDQRKVGIIHHQQKGKKVSRSASLSCPRMCLSTSNALGNNCNPYTKEDARLAFKVLERMYGTCSRFTVGDLEGRMIRGTFSNNFIPPSQPQKLTLSSLNDA